jgi:hypothetical protein
MKKLMLGLVLGILLISSMAFVVAEENDTDVCDSDTNECVKCGNTCVSSEFAARADCLETTEDFECECEDGLCEMEVEDEDEEDEIECENLNQEECEASVECNYYFRDEFKEKDDDENETEEEDKVDGWCKKTRERKGRERKAEPKGYAFGYRFRLRDTNISFEEFKERIREKFGNKSDIDNRSEIRDELRVKLSNGRKANLKILPIVARERALERLRLKVCNEDNECEIELKEVGEGEGNKTRVAYELQIQRHHKLLGLFRIKARNRVRVDAETGEVIHVKKPWWAFLASEEDETEDTEGNETEDTEE